MIKMTTKQNIIYLYGREGRSLRGIARDLGINRATVTKIVREYEKSLNEGDESEDSLDEYLKELKLTSFKEYLEDVEKQANAEQWSYRSFLIKLMESEVARRMENRKDQRLRRAILPDLETLNFIREGRNVMMYGNPGTGKTHIAIGLGIKACNEGYTVFFSTVPQLLMKIREAVSSRTLNRLQDRFRRYDLVVCDEFGYTSFDKEGGEQIFNLLSLRAGKKATITTTNLIFTRWDEIIKDKALCSALVDRLCHKAYLVNMSGASYRVKETQKMLDNML